MNVYPVILAAGRGTRLQLMHQPKALIPIKNKSLIFHTLETLQKLSLPKINIVIGYLGKVIETRVNFLYKNINYIRQDPLNGTGGALLQLFDQTKIADDDYILVLNADDSWLYTDTDLSALIARRQPDKLAMLITADDKDEHNYYRKVILDDHKQFQKFSDESLPGEYLACGCFIATKHTFVQLLSHVLPNYTGEIGLPDILYHIDPTKVEVVIIPPEHWHGINTIQELEKAQAKVR